MRSAVQAPSLTLLMLWLATSIGFSLAAGAEPIPLPKEIDLGPGCRFSPLGDGGFVTFEPPSGKITARDENGQVITSFTVPGAISQATVSELAARPGFVLVVANSAPEGEVRATVLSLETHLVVGDFKPPQWPARVFGSMSGWFFRARDPNVPTIVEVNNDGRKLQSLGVPKTIADRVESETGRRDAARLLAAAVGDGLWAVPNGMYEIWQLKGRAQRFDVPKCMWIAGNQLEGDVARQRALQTLDGVSENIRHQIETRLYSSMGTGQAFQAFFSAIPAVASYRDRLAVLVDALPQLSTGNGRIDVWQLPAGVLVASVPVPGELPHGLALGSRLAWVRHRRTVSPILLPEHPSASPLGCAPAKVLELARSAQTSLPQGATSQRKAPLPKKHGQS